MNAVSSLTVKGWFSRGWNTYKKNPKQLIGGAGILFGYSLGLTLLSLAPQSYWALIIGCNIFITPVFSIGWLYLCLMIVRGENVKPQTSSTSSFQAAIQQPSGMK